MASDSFSSKVIDTKLASATDRIVVSGIVVFGLANLVLVIMSFSEENSIAKTTDHPIFVSFIMVMLWVFLAIDFFFTKKARLTDVNRNSYTDSDPAFQATLARIVNERGYLLIMEVRALNRWAVDLEEEALLEKLKNRSASEIAVKGL